MHASGQQRARVPARAMRVDLAREWGPLTARDLGRRLHRDPSMISRLAAAYAAHRDPTAETRLRQTMTSRHPK